MDAKPRLTFELVPETAWWSNVRSQVSTSDWEKCKKYTRDKSGSRCEICGGRGSRWPTEAHEIWAYDDERQVQTLVGLIALCPTCHKAKHIGRTQAVGSPAEIAWVYAHIKKVNNWTDENLLNALDNAYAIWSIRSSWDWHLDVRWLQTIGIGLPKYTWTIEERKA